MDQISETQDDQTTADKDQAAWDAKYPEHAKLRAVRGESQHIGQFLDWLIHERGDTHICVWPEGHNYPSSDHTATIEGLLGEYFDIDPKALSREKDEMYDELQKSRGGEE